MTNAIYQALAEAARQNEPVALGILTGVKGSSPQKAGAKALFFGDGRLKGTVGGGCLEAEVQHRALHALRTGQPATFELVLESDFGWDDGLMCGGRVSGIILPDAARAGALLWPELAVRQHPITWGVRKNFSIALVSSEAGAAGWLYQETVSPPCALWIAGAGHIAQAVAPLALALDFGVTVFDDRPALANDQFFPREVCLCVGDWNTLVARVLPAAPTFGLIVTRGHRHDTLVLRQWIQRPFAFLGMIGSQRKGRTVRERFLEERLATPEQLDRLACPVGLPIHAVSVQEIAVSILAQFVEKRAGLLPGLERAS
jgi:xanthine dehydrogenase accessory factor